MRDPQVEQEKVDQLLIMVGEAIDSKRYSEAKSNVDKVLKIQPFNPLGLFYKGLNIALTTDDSCNVSQAYKEYVVAVKAGKAYKAKENRLNSQMKKFSKGYQDALFNLTWVFKQNINPVSNEVREATEHWISVCEFGLMYNGMISEAVNIASVELANNMQISKYKFELGMNLWTFCSNDYETIPFAAEHFIIPAIDNMSPDEKKNAVTRINMYAAHYPDKFEVWYETFMDVWSNALGIDYNFEAAATQLPKVAFIMLTLSDSIQSLNSAVYCLYRSIYEYDDPLSVRNNISESHRILDSQLSSYKGGNKDYIKNLRAYSSAFNDIYELSSFMDRLHKSDSDISVHANDDFEYDPYPLLDELYSQYTKMFKNKKDIERIKSEIADQLRLICRQHGYS